MPYCPECGGEMRYDASLRRHICKSCGLSLTSQELMELRDRLRPKGYEPDERKQKKKEYLDWWFSRKE